MRTATVVVIVSMHTSKSKVSPNGHAAGKKRWTDDCRIIKTTTSTLVFYFSSNNSTVHSTCTCE